MDDYVSRRQRENPVVGSSHRAGADVLAKRLIVTLAVATAGWTVASLADLHELDRSRTYLAASTALLAVGLFGSTYGISVAQLRQHRGVVIRAVTVGVLLKAALISSVMVAVFRDPAFIVVGVAVAQIDPLSVAVMRHRVRLSERAKSILAAWSSFDDPVTAVLAVLFVSVAIGTGALTVDGASTFQGGLAGVGIGLAGNVLVIALLAAVWFILVRLSERQVAQWRRHQRRRKRKPPTISPPLRPVAIVVLVLVAATAVNWMLLLGLAVAGLFYRPRLDALLEWLTSAALWVALFMLGLVLADGVRWWPGILLGLAAFGAQIAVGALLTRSLPGDRLRLAFSQQNGITAVILALLLETVIPGTVAVVAPAVLTVNVIHLMTNRLLDTVTDRAAPKPVERERTKVQRTERKPTRTDTAMAAAGSMLLAGYERFRPGTR